MSITVALRTGPSERARTARRSPKIMPLTPTEDAGKRTAPFEFFGAIAGEGWRY